jgi:hypothetical protein
VWGWWRTQYGGHLAKNYRPTRVESDPQQRALGEEPQEQAEEADGEHGEVPGARPMIHGVLVRVTHRTGCGLVLRWVLRFAGAQRRVADQV